MLSYGVMFVFFSGKLVIQQSQSSSTISLLLFKPPTQSNHFVMDGMGLEVIQ